MHTYTDRILAAPSVIVQNTIDKSLRTPQEIFDDLRMLQIMHWDFGGQIRLGWEIVHLVMLQTRRRYYRLAWELKFPIHSVIPACFFDWDDRKSCDYNNSSCHNMRRIDDGTGRWSLHAVACAGDTNPVQNPCIIFDDNGLETDRVPLLGVYDEDAPGTLTGDHELVKYMEGEGLDWGGRWTTLKDPQHFQMKRELLPDILRKYVG